MNNLVPNIESKCITDCIKNDEMQKEAIRVSEKLVFDMMEYSPIFQELAVCRSSKDLKVALKKLDEPINKVHSTLSQLAKKSKQQKNTCKKIKETQVQCVKDTCSAEDLEKYRQIIIYSAIMNYIFNHPKMQSLFKEMMKSILHKSTMENNLHTLDLLVQK